MSDPVRPEHADTLVVAPELAQTQADTSGKSLGTIQQDLDRGAAIGRYLVVDQLGAGAMGTVYAAYDPELDRKVAIKLLRFEGDATDSDGRARLLREAQAIARVAHPNVVAVHDVGTCLTDQVFIAMELVAGVTLGTWLQASARTTAEIVEVFAQAGRGLAAAHAAGLVHRDFKPENVLVGQDGRARVVDFGLVRSVDAPPEIAPDDIESSGARNSLLNVSLTHVGTIMGTPRYMAPEQRQRRTADARADQYSFCVSLYEALNGDLPSVDTAPFQKQPADVVRLPSHSVPPHARIAIRRGLSADPAARWPSMEALIAELVRDPSARRRRWLVGGGVAVALAGVAVAIVLAARSQAASDPCAGAGDRLADVWNPARRATLERAFTATKTPYAAAALATVSHDLDDYAAAWTHSYAESCRATHVRHEQSVDMLDLRTACLASRRSELAAAIALLGTADAKLVRRAVDTVSDLSPLSSCDGLTTMQHLPVDPAARKEIEAMREELAQVQALASAGKFNDGLPRAKALYARSLATPYKPVQAEVSAVLARLQWRTGDQAGNLKTYIEGYAAAVASHDDELQLKIALGLAGAYADSGQVPRAEDWERIMDASLESRANPSLSERTGVLSLHAHLLSTAGKFAESAAEHEKVRAIRDTSDPNSYLLGQTYTALAYTYDEAGDYEKARARGERGLAIEIAALGPNHPEIAKVLNNLGNIAVDEGNDEMAHAYYARSLAIREQSVVAGEDPSELADVIHNLGTMALDLDHYDEAVKLFERAIAVRNTGAPDNTEVALPMEGIAIVHQKRHEYAAALAGFDAAMKVVERLGPEHPYVGDVLVGRGAALRELGRLDEAQRELEHALAIRTKDARPIELADVEFELGKTVWLRGDKARGHALVTQARTHNEGSAAAAKQLVEIETWLKSH